MLCTPLDSGRLLGRSRVWTQQEQVLSHWNPITPCLLPALAGEHSRSNHVGADPHPLGLARI